MLHQGQRLAAADGLRNLTFTLGDVSDLPYIDDQFDLAVCRLALHQVADPAAMVKEMVRVTRPGGRVVLTDMITDDDPALAQETNRLERLRDPSHNRTLPIAEIRALVEEAGAAVESASLRDHGLETEDWMARSQTPDAVKAQIRARFEEELAGGPATGLLPTHGSDGALRFTHIWATVTATVKS